MTLTRVQYKGLESKGNGEATARGGKIRYCTTDGDEMSLQKINYEIPRIRTKQTRS